MVDRVSLLLHYPLIDTLLIYVRAAQRPGGCRIQLIVAVTDHGPRDPRCSCFQGRNPRVDGLFPICETRRLCTVGPLAATARERSPVRILISRRNRPSVTCRQHLPRPLRKGDRDCGNEPGGINVASHQPRDRQVQDRETVSSLF